MITSHPDAPEGLVSSLSVYTSSAFTPNSAILCRNTAPLVKFAYSLLQRDIPCYIRGKDIGASLAILVKKMHAANLPDLRERLSSWHNREAQRLLGEDRSTEKIDDQFACLYYFIDSLDESSQSVASLLAKVDLMFSDQSSSSKVCLSTVHKAKGLEFPTVFILDFTLMPSKYAKLPWQKKQERNLIYVAITRSMHTLHYISSDCWEQKEETV